MKEAFYFSHDYNATQDPKIIILLSKCGLAGLGAFWIIIEILHQEPKNQISKEAYLAHLKMYYEMHPNGTCDYDNICSTLVETGLLIEQSGVIFSERVMENKKRRDFISQQRSMAGKVSAAKRLRTSVERAIEQNSTKERKRKERKGNNNKDILSGKPDIEAPITYLNEKTKSNFDPKNKSNRELIKARYNEGRTLEQFKQVIDKKTTEWLNDEKMMKYLRPSTLFSRTNFENYINEPIKSTSTLIFKKE